MSIDELQKWLIEINKDINKLKKIKNYVESELNQRLDDEESLFHK